MRRVLAMVRPHCTGRPREGPYTACTALQEGPYLNPCHVYLLPGREVRSTKCPKKNYTGQKGIQVFF
jgi:hypothetical protein